MALGGRAPLPPQPPADPFDRRLLLRAQRLGGRRGSDVRPLSANLYYFAGRSLFGNDIEVYHTIDALTHVANGVLLFLLCRQVLPGLFSLIPPVLFVSRLAHGQDFEYTSNFDTLSYAAFSLLGLLLFVSARRRERRLLEALAVGAFALALLCKEAAVVWPAILTAYGWLFDRSRVWRKYVAAWVVTFACLAALAQETGRRAPRRGCRERGPGGG